MDRLRVGATLCGLVVLLVGALFMLPTVMHVYGLANEISLPLLAIAGVLVLLGALALVSIAFSLMNLSDRSEALALPSGSIRAVIALSLVVLFAILTVFLFSSLDNGGRVQKLVCLKPEAKDALVRNLGPQQVLLILDTPISATGEPCSGKPGPVPAGTGKGGEGGATTAAPAEPSGGAPGSAQSVPQTSPPGAAGAPAPVFFAVYYRDLTDPASIDFAKQLLVLIGTLVTAVAAFYFGAKAVSDAQAAAAPNPPPTLVGINPTTAPPGGLLTPLRITGSNLNSVAHAQLVSGSAQILDNGVVSNPSQVQANFQIPTSAPADSRWDVVVTDAAGRTARLPAALHITPAQAAASSTPPPTLTGITPDTAPVAGELRPLRIAGSNLGSIAQAQLVSGDSQIPGTDLVATPTEVRVNFQIPPTAPPDSRWDVVVTDTAGRTARLLAALHVIARQ